MKGKLPSTYVIEDRPRYGFQQNKMHFFNTNPIKIRSGFGNPLNHLRFYYLFIEEFLRKHSGLRENLNAVVRDIYDLGASRPCADLFCRYGQAWKVPAPDVTRQTQTNVRDYVEPSDPLPKSFSATSSTETEPSATVRDVAYCLPAPVEGKELTPRKATAWSRRLRSRGKLPPSLPTLQP